MINYESIDKEIGIKILLLRKILGLKQQEFAEAIGIAVPTLSRLENNKTELSKELALIMLYELERIDEDEISDYQKDYIDEFSNYLENIIHNSSNSKSIADILIHKEKNSIEADHIATA